MQFHFPVRHELRALCDKKKLLTFSTCRITASCFCERRMGIVRNTSAKMREKNIPAPTPWRVQKTSIIGTTPYNTSPLKQITGCRLNFMQALTITLLTSYIFLPSRVIANFSSGASVSKVFNTGRNFFVQTTETGSSISKFTEKNAGVAIVAACSNRQESLKQVLPTWLAVKGVREIVIVDWNSYPPLKSVVHPEKDSRLSLYRVMNESSWVLSRAYNLAMNKTTQKYVIRTDCDYSLGSDILDVHDLNETENGFYSGNWRRARNENEIHLNGAMIMKRDAFWNVGGYDERIQTYGWDDEDLYARLASQKLKRLNISYKHINHTWHDDRNRLQQGVKFAQVQIDLNQLLLEKLPLWSKSDFEGAISSQYRVLNHDENGGYFELQAKRLPKSLNEHVENEVYQELWALALGMRLADDFHVPWDVLETIDSVNKELLLDKLLQLQSKLASKGNSNQNGSRKAQRQFGMPTESRIFFVHCLHSLGNRLRALGSALAFARANFRVPVIIWERDLHMQADFGALFNVSNFVVIKKFIHTGPLNRRQKYDDAWSHFRFYDFTEMEKNAVKGEYITNDQSKHIYYNGACIRETTQYTGREADNEELRNLEPVQIVRKKLQELRHRGLSSAVGVCIRNRTLTSDIKKTHLNQEYGLDAAPIREHWRKQNPYRNIVPEMKRILRQEQEKAQFYIATDTREVISRMEELFPGRILSTKRKCDGRDSECAKYAVIDMYALSKTRKLLCSNWSSYTEMVERLGGLKAKLAGRDFGRGGTESRDHESQHVGRGILRQENNFSKA